MQLGLSKSDLEDYLSKPPNGIDARIWKQAVSDNPDSTKFIPVPLVGFKAIQSRVLAQVTKDLLLNKQLKP